MSETSDKFLKSYILVSCGVALSLFGLLLADTEHWRELSIANLMSLAWIFSGVFAGQFAGFLFIAADVAAKPVCWLVSILDWVFFYQIYIAEPDPFSLLVGPVVHLLGAGVVMSVGVMVGAAEK